MGIPSMLLTIRSSIITGEPTFGTNVKKKLVASAVVSLCSLISSMRTLIAAGAPEAFMALMVSLLE